MRKPLLKLVEGSKGRPGVARGEAGGQHGRQPDGWEARGSAGAAVQPWKVDLEVQWGGGGLCCHWGSYAQQRGLAWGGRKATTSWSSDGRRRGWSPRHLPQAGGPLSLLGELFQMNGVFDPLRVRVELRSRTNPRAWTRARSMVIVEGLPRSRTSWVPSSLWHPLTVVVVPGFRQK